MWVFGWKQNENRVTIAVCDCLSSLVSDIIFLQEKQSREKSFFGKSCTYIPNYVCEVFHSIFPIHNNSSGNVKHLCFFSDHLGQHRISGRGVYDEGQRKGKHDGKKYY